MNGYGKTTRIVITAMVVLLGAIYLGAGYLGSDITAQSRQLGRLGQLLVAMLLAAAALLGIFKLIGKLWDMMVDRQSRDDDSGNPNE